MSPFFRIAPLALVLLPSLSRAQAASASAIGLEIPAPAAPSRGHFLTGAYVVGAYTPLPTSTAYGYSMQPYLRYELGNSTKGRLRAFVQYSFAPYRMPAYASRPFYGADGAASSSAPGFAPLALRSAPYGSTPYGSYGGLGAFSAGVPVRIGNGSAMLNLGGSIVREMLTGVVW